MSRRVLIPWGEDMIMSTTPFEVTFVTVPMPEGTRDRLALHVGGHVVCRTPALRPGKGLGTTHPGSACYVESRNSKAVARLEGQLKEGSRFLLPCTSLTQKAKMGWSVTTLAAFASKAQAQKAQDNWAALRGAKSVKSAKSEATAKEATPQITPEDLADFRAWQARKAKG